MSAIEEIIREIEEVNKRIKTKGPLVLFITPAHYSFLAWMKNIRNSFTDCVGAKLIEGAD